ncbi:MAG: hypothetical protein AAF938_27100, partial [Myxococcota bacterium]
MANRPMALGAPPKDLVQRERIAWLIRLRWGAMLGAFGGVAAGLVGLVPGVAWPLAGATAVFGLCYNGVLWQALSSGAPRSVFHAPLT